MVRLQIYQWFVAAWDVELATVASFIVVVSCISSNKSHPEWDAYPSNFVVKYTSEKTQHSQEWFMNQLSVLTRSGVLLTQRYN